MRLLANNTIKDFGVGLIILLGLIDFASLSSTQTTLILPNASIEKDQNRKYMNVTYKNVENQKIIDCFEIALDRYKTLHNYEITLVQKSIKGSTMQAQPIITIGSVVKGVKRYRIKLAKHVRDEEKLPIAGLDEDVLIGWFAHELGHLMDYQQYSNLQMIGYGVKYLLSAKQRKIIEHDADYIAIAHGFHEEILATKKFILEHDLIQKDYKEKIKQFYLPEADVLMCSEDKKLMEPYLNL
jgi:hypothetical protein